MNVDNKLLDKEITSMEAKSSLVIFTKAAKMLAEADTIQKVKELKDLALTAKEWAKRKGMGDEAILHCHRYMKRAEIRLGEMLAATVRAKRGPDKETGQRSQRVTPDNEPTLEELGITKRESSQAQRLAKLDEKSQEALIEDEKTEAQIKREIKEAKREEQRQEAIRTAPKSDKRIIVGDFRENTENVGDGTLSLIFTDPPYNRKAAKLFPGLASFAKAKLAVGGSILVYAAHINLHEAMNAFDSELRYWWTICCLHSGKKALMTEYGIRVGWKPVLWYVKETRGDKRSIVEDVMSGGEEKDSHDWQQAESEATYWIEKLCPRDGIVCDPFLGSGTTGIAAEKLKRKWIGFELNEATAATTRKRIKDYDAAI